ALGIEAFFHQQRLPLRQPRLDPRQLGEGHVAACADPRHQLDPLAALQAPGRAAAVGAGQAAGAELDAAVPAGDQHHHAVAVLPFDGGQDRPAGGAAGLAVVAEAVLLAAPEGPAVVRGAGVAVLLDEGQRLLRRLDGRGQGEEAALADFLAIFAGTGEGEGHQLCCSQARRAATSWKVQATKRLCLLPWAMSTCRISSAPACLSAALRPGRLAALDTRLLNHSTWPATVTLSRAMRRRKAA